MPERTPRDKLAPAPSAKDWRRALDIVVPATILARADEVME
jgi:hypothetical protein